MKRRTKKQTRELREQIVKLRDRNDFSFREIAKMLKLKSSVLASYHYKKSKVGKKK